VRREGEGEGPDLNPPCRISRHDVFLFKKSVDREDLVQPSRPRNLVMYHILDKILGTREIFLVK